MSSYEVTQAFLTAGSVYQVRRPREAAVLFTVRSVPMNPTPKYRLVEGEEGTEVGLLTGNFIKTEYEIHDASRVLGLIVFPAVAFNKTLTLRVGDDSYESDGGVFRGTFPCRSKDGEVVLEITKELSIRDTFSVRAKDALPYQVGLLSAVAIHARFYDMV